MPRKVKLRVTIDDLTHVVILPEPAVAAVGAGFLNLMAGLSQFGTPELAAKAQEVSETTGDQMIRIEWIERWDRED